MALRIFTEPQQGASYDQLLAVARTAEKCGFSAFFRSDHFLKMGSGSGLRSTTDAWITMAGLARDTSTIRLGTLVSPVTFRPVGTFIVTATQVDRMSDGRVEIGLGAGWYKAEHDAFGLSFPEPGARYDLLEDQLAILHGAWSAAPNSTYEFSGKTCRVRIDAETVRTVQKPHPPIIMGGSGGPRSARMAAAIADEYNVSFVPKETTREVHDRVRKACESIDRDPAALAWSAAQVVCCGRTESEIARRAEAIGSDAVDVRKNGLGGTPAEILENLEGFASLGVDRFYLQVLDLTDLDHLRLLADEVLPHAPGR